MIFQLYFIFILPLVLSLVLTPLVIRLAKRIGAMDQPNERKVHKFPIPRLGGLAIYGSFFLSLVLYIYFDPALHPFASMHPKTGIMLLISLTIVLILGLWDDMRQLSPGKKFFFQFLAASIVYFAGFRISSITHPFSLNLLNLGILDFPATLLWIVGITNAFNLIDGLDGLASGVAFIVSLTICSISFILGDLNTATEALLLAGAVLGFLRYNFGGARIFLGDSGSLFLGFSLAILSMQSSTKGSTAFSILVPVLALGLPIMDTMLAMVRRFLRSVFPEDEQPKSLVKKVFSMFLPDRGHIHHQLIARGLSHRNVVLLLYVVSCLFGVGAFAVTMTNNIGTTPILIAIGIATFIGVSQLRYREMAMLRNGMLLPLYDWPLFNSNLFQGFLDLAFILAAYTGASFLQSRTDHPFAFTMGFFQSLMLLAGIQMSVFYLAGLYKGAFRQFGMSDMLKVLSTVALALIVTWTVFSFLPKEKNLLSLNIVVMNFYFLLSLVMGARVSFHVLNYLSRRDQCDGKKKVLIYGAGSESLLTVQKILSDEKLGYCPVGFLDDDPKLQGKRLNGYPIFGGHLKLEGILRKMKIEEIIISTDALMPKVLERVRQIARANGVILRRTVLHFEEFPTPGRPVRREEEQLVLIEH
jgi:UDP-GlcNAc:undecaprenyl-phosphate GlcNAc-1-phosphate transferase